MPMTTRGSRLPSGFWKGSTGRPRARRPTTKSLAPRARKAVAKIAERVMKRRTETKYVGSGITTDNQNQEVWASTYPTNGAPQIWNALPGVSEGDASYDRTGVKINPLSHVVNVNLKFNNLRNDISNTGPLDNCAWDITAHIWYGYVRRYKNGADVVANAPFIVNQMLEDGVGNSFKWDGTQNIDVFRLNQEVVDLKHKKVRMYRPFGTQNKATLAGGVTTYFPQKTEARLRLSFKPPKTLLYAEGNDIPQNYAPVIIIGYVHNDGSNGASSDTAGASIATSPALMVYMYGHMTFKDA